MKPMATYRRFMRLRQWWRRNRLARHQRWLRGLAEECGLVGAKPKADERSSIEVFKRINGSGA